MPRSPRSLLLAIAGLLPLAACGASAGVTSGPSGPDTIGLPADGSALIVQVGGWLPAITADGRVFTDAVREPPVAGLRSSMVPAPPAPQPVAVAQMTADGVQQMLREARRLGLLAPPPVYGDPNITDVGTATLTLATAGGTFVHSVYAPGARTGVSSQDAARDRFEEFGRYIMERVAGVDAELGEARPYVPARWTVKVDRVHDGTDRALPWPFADAPEEGCRRFAIAGARDTVTGVYSAVIAGRDRIVSIRPALPFDRC